MSFEQDRIKLVEHKLNALSESIEQLSDSVGEVKLGLDALRKDGHGLGYRSNHSSSHGVSHGAGIIGNYSDFAHGRLIGFSGQQHKDILDDGDALNGEERGEARKMAPEMQVQRLSAQLTAAYSRIAALEEQLLAQRVH
ncbi:MAG: hypothetical protein HC857_03175 [Synechococcales cyanobacterium RU_4_20]|nr:hypothetical protein [Synechococcales cyanobacterium RU_4_20]NJR70109.1 hypothetical protein [Synechococcales cyanobacterium CRU_2_2]